MSDLSQSNALDRFALSNRDSVRIELPAVTPIIYVEPYCGPAADMVRINWFELTSSAFMTPASALALADAIRTVALRTANPPVELKREEATDAA
jgi:hypothetical protein